MLNRTLIAPLEYTSFEPIIFLKSSRFLSVGNDFSLFLGERQHPSAIVHMYKTADMQTGELVYMEDLIEINEDFAKLLGTGGILRQDEIVFSGGGIATAEFRTQQIAQYELLKEPL